MNLNKCSRCGAFHTNSGDVCPKCASKDSLELSTFKSYVEENGFPSIDTVATQTGIAQKNISRFASYQGIQITDAPSTKEVAHSGIVLN